MTEQNVEIVSKLYKKKSELLKDLSELTDKEHNFSLCVNYIHSMYDFKLNCSNIFSDEIKEILIVKIKEGIKKIDFELENIKC